jgi:hypothetical protein
MRRNDAFHLVDSSSLVALPTSNEYSICQLLFNVIVLIDVCSAAPLRGPHFRCELMLECRGSEVVNWVSMTISLLSKCGSRPRGPVAEKLHNTLGCRHLIIRLVTPHCRSITIACEQDAAYREPQNALRLGWVTFKYRAWNNDRTVISILIRGESIGAFRRSLMYIQYVFLAVGS